MMRESHNLLSILVPHLYPYQRDKSGLVHRRRSLCSCRQEGGGGSKEGKGAPVSCTRPSHPFYFLPNRRDCLCNGGPTWLTSPGDDTTALSLVQKDKSCWTRGIVNIFLGVPQGFPWGSLSTVEFPIYQIHLENFLESVSNEMCQFVEWEEGSLASGQIPLLKQ